MASESRSGSGWPQVILVALVVLGVGVIVFWPNLDNPGRRREAAPPTSGRGSAGGDDDRATLVRDAAEAAQALVTGRWTAIIDRARAAAAAGPDDLWLFVWTLFTALDALETDEQKLALRGFFETGRDVRFGQSFAVGPGGWLRDWPTLRVALFDYVCQRDPGMAAELALEILQNRPEEPGEWTLALRELARGQTATEWTSLVQVRVREFIHDREWTEQGSAAWAEGFDVLVAGRSPEHLGDLADISARSSGREARFVAFVTADRLVMAVPAPCLTALNDDPRLFSESTGVRAGLFARADVRDPAQRAELIRYFGRGDVGPGERAQFAAAFPHLSAPLTHRLLTRPVVRSPAEVQAAETLALRLLDEWSAMPEFAAWVQTYGEVRRRLEARAAMKPAHR